LAGILFAVTYALIGGFLGLRYIVIPSGVVLVGLIIGGRGWGRWRYYRRLAPPDGVEPSDESPAVR
jgi:hypothetical protein